MPNTYTELDTKSLSGISSITFTSIPQTYTDLVLVIKGVSSANQPANFRVGNGSVDTGSNYSRTGLSGNGSSATSYRGSSEVYFYTDNASDTNGGAVSTTYFMNYSNTTTNKTFLNRNGATSNNVRAIVGLWRSTVAINTISADFGATLTGGTASLYGIANADQGAAKATGGIITEDSQYWYHTFGASSAFIPKQSLTCDVLAIAGGGGGGRYGGGGGAGGYRLLTSQSFSVTSHTVTVGGGGTGGTGNDGGVGSVSSVNGISANIGGGGGGYASNAPTGTLGSGGGAGYPDGANTTGAAGTSGQGFAGGNATNGHFAGGGGGGADSVGGVSTSGRVGGNGGTAIAVPSAWLSATSIGISGFIAGGGGGCGQNGAGTATGGGGIGATNNNGTTGRPNTGGGGGGGYAATGGTNANGFAGGSGVVVIRYAK